MSQELMLHPAQELDHVQRQVRSPASDLVKGKEDKSNQLLILLPKSQPSDLQLTRVAVNGASHLLPMLLVQSLTSFGNKIWSFSQKQ